MIKKIGIDIGNYDTKTQDTTTPSGYYSQSTKPSFDDDYLVYNGMYYIPTTERFPYLMDKTTDDRCIILSLFGIAKQILHEIGDKEPACVQREINKISAVNLGVGLPIGHCDALTKKTKDYYQKKFINGIRFSYRKYNFNLTLDGCKVYPQDFTAAFSNTDSTIVSKYDSYCIVGIGGYTVDICIVNHGKPDIRRCRSIELGTIVMYDNIKRKVMSESGLNVPTKTIEDVLFNREHILPEPVVKTIMSATKEHAKEIINTCRTSGFDFQVMPCVFVGGGALILQQFIENNPMISLCEFISDINANAKSYAKFLKING